MTLVEVLAELLDEAGDVEVVDDFEYARSGVAFARRTGGDRIELRLGAEIAEAARRTPGTSVSSRGPDWILFAPREWDEHATDRLGAWFRVAWRAAAGSGR